MTQTSQYLYSDIDVEDYRTSADYYGQTVLNPCSTCTYNSAVVYLNQKYMDPASDFTRTQVVTHEFGHVLGLAHTTYDPSIMETGPVLLNKSFNTPQQYDINDVNGIYP
jgi:predicted Zn-dependent protease